MTDEEQTCIGQAVKVLDAEIKAIERLRSNIDRTFAQAVDALVEHAGKVVVCGVGKSGIVARKLAATLSSTGTPAAFLHAAEGLHGDLGMLFSEDVLILISKSGESEEILRLLPSIKTISPTIITLTGDMESSIADAADIILDCGVEREADPLNLAPTASVIAAQAMGDALAMAVATRKQLTPERFALSHPGGALGRRLTVKVEHLMHGGDEQPTAHRDTPMRDVVIVMTGKAMGAVNIVDDSGTLEGIITDGDLRRGIQKHDRLLDLTAADLMTKQPIAVSPDTMAIDALRTMEDRPSQIMVLPVVDDAGKAIGILRLHDIIKAGLRK